MRSSPTIAALLLPVALIGCTAPLPAPADPGSADRLAFSTHLGGNDEDTARDVTVDAAGNVYVTGGTASPDFPVTAGAYDTSANGSMDAFVARLAPDGRLLWSTRLGGPRYDRAYAIEIDSRGDVVIGGRAGDGFPTTAGAAQPTFGGDSDANRLYGAQDGFVARLSADGARLLWSTYIASSDRSFVRDLALDPQGDVYVAVTDVTRPHPLITPDVLQPRLAGGRGGVVARIDSGGSRIKWATYLDGGSTDLGTPSIRIAPGGGVVVLGGTDGADLPTTPHAFDRSHNGGWDLYVAVLSADGRQLLAATYLGGSAGEFSETHGLAVTAGGDFVVAATTHSADFPVTAGAFQPQYAGGGGSGTGRGTNYPGDGVIARLSADGSRLVASTFLGGPQGDGIEGVAVATGGAVAVAGATYSATFPVTAQAAQPRLRGEADMFAALLSPDLTRLVYGTFLGGSAIDYGRSAALDAGGHVILGGQSASADWPAVRAAQTRPGGELDAAVARLPALTPPAETP